uniref:Single domain-containing protein n=1 Tax=Amblyomma parvum TaxID=251391 RepID=A0A023G2L7_AMBPA
MRTQNYAYKNMLKTTVQILLLAIALMVHIGFGAEENEASLQFVNNTCHYRGYIIGDKDAEYETEFCEKWECDVGRKKLTVTGCYIDERYGSCFDHSRHTMSWPQCCHTYRSYC